MAAERSGALPRRAHHLEVAAHHLAQRLRVEALAEARRSLEVAEEDRDDLPQLLGRRLRDQGRAAEPAQTEPIGVLLAAVRTIEQPNEHRGRSGSPEVARPRFRGYRELVHRTR